MDDWRPNRRRALAAGLSMLGGAALFPDRLGAAPLSRAGAAPVALGRPDLGRRILVHVTLYGGNDGLNTVCPYEDDAYHRARPDLGLAPGEVLPIEGAGGERRGLHPALVGLRAAWDRGELAIVEGVGYPRPVLSHTRSFEIWNHASRSGATPDGDGWIGRLRRLVWSGDSRPELALHVGSHVSGALSSRTHPALMVESAERFVWLGDPSARAVFRAAADRAPAALPTGSDRAAVLARLRGTLRAAQAASPRILQIVEQYRPRAEPPAADPFGRDLATVAALIRAGFDARVYSVSIGNFDHHGPQRRAHETLLGRLDRGVAFLLDELRGTPFADDVLVVAHSEFGRRVEQNASGGTDHGTAGPMLLVGPSVRGGLHGRAPSLVDLDADGNLKYTTDFRSVVATLAEDWYGIDGATLIGEAWPKLPLLGA